MAASSGTAIAMFRPFRVISTTYRFSAESAVNLSRGHYPVLLYRMELPVVYQCSWRHKHWNPKFKKERRQKFLKVELPDFEALRKEEKMTPEEIRAKMKEKGIVPPRPWMERPIFISCTGGIFDPYVPPEGDGKITFLSKEGTKQKMELVSKKGNSYLSLRKIRSFDYEFDLPSFAETAQEIYITAHTALSERDEDKLHELVTEKCYPEMVANTEKKTIRWKFIQSLEPPYAVHIRCTDVLTKENVFAQLTVRFHTQQTLAVYDRFGRLMHGSEEIVKDVLEYVVFEKHLASQYGIWRIHGKIIPDWLPKREPIAKTWRIDDKSGDNHNEKSDTDTSDIVNTGDLSKDATLPPAVTAS